MPSTSAIDPTLGGDLTEDGRAVDKSDLQAAFQAAKDELDAIFAYAEPHVDIVDPVAGNDTTEGYVRGSRWINTTTPSLWECVDPATGSAQWVRIDGSGGGGGLELVTDANASISIAAMTDGTWRTCTDAAPEATVLAACPVGTHVRLERAGTGPITVNWQGPQAAGAGARYFTADDHGGTPSNSSFTVQDWVEFLCVSNSDGDSAVIEVEVSGSSIPTQSSAPHDFNGQQVSGNYFEVVTRGADSAQPNATVNDSGKGIRTDGLVVIPNVAGWHCTMLITDVADDIQHNGLTLDISVAGFQVGEEYAVRSWSSTEITVSGPAGQFNQTNFAS